MATNTFKIVELSYGYDAFLDTGDFLTIEIHYTKH